MLDTQTHPHRPPRKQPNLQEAGDVVAEERGAVAAEVVGVPTVDPVDTLTASPLTQRADSGLPSLLCPKGVLAHKPEFPVGGRLPHFQDYWSKNVKDIWALEIIQKGYALEFQQEPPPPSGIRWTPSMAPSKDALMLEEIHSLQAKNAIEVVPQANAQAGFYSMLFLVPKKDGTLRPVINLRPLNAYIKVRHFKMETLRSVIRFVKPGDWLASLDLKDAYLHVPIRPSHRQYLRFAFQGVCYQFKVLPFGLNTAPMVWTKVLAPIMEILHLEGIYISPYLDDLLIRDTSRLGLSRALHRCIDVLLDGGFVINITKSELIPTQDLIYVGGRFRTDLGIVTLPQDRFPALQKAVAKFKPGHQVQALLFQQLLGQMASMLDVIPWARFHMRPLQSYLKRHWLQGVDPQSTKILISRELHIALLWWTRRKNIFKGSPLIPPQPDIILTTDASKAGWGGFLPHCQTQGLWTVDESQLHINILELQAIFLALQAFEDMLVGKVVLCRCDNTTACSYIAKMGGTRSPSLQKLLDTLLHWCIQRDIVLQSVYLPGVENTLADLLSRTQADHKEWALPQHIVDLLFQLWGTPSTDLFASRQNAKLHLYYSLYPDPSSASKLDGLAIPWSNMVAYAFPPKGMIPLVITKVSQDQMPFLILIAPVWTRRTWYPLLVDLLCHQPVLLPTQAQCPGLLTQTVQGQLLRHPQPDQFCLAAWPITGIPSKAKAFRRRLLQQSWPGEVTPPIADTVNAGRPLVAGVRQGVSILFRQLQW